MAGAAGRLIALLAVGAASIAAGPAAPITQFAGRYTDSYPDPLSGQALVSRLDILPLDGNHAYVDVTLQFPNGFNCGTSGVARVVGEELIYTASPGDPCRMTIGREGHRIIVSDGEADSCRSDCGMNAEMEGSFELARRRAIPDPVAVRRSREYRRATSAWRVHG